MKKRVFKIFWIVLLVVLVFLQFVPVDRTNPPVDESLDFLATENLSAEGRDILKQACYDCHSYETEHPWYSYVAPVSFFIEDHVKHGRGELNFSEFQSYSKKKKDHKLEETIEALKEGWMPLESYIILHGNAKLTQEQRAMLAAEIAQIRQDLQVE